MTTTLVLVRGDSGNSPESAIPSIITWYLVLVPLDKRNHFVDSVKSPTLFVRVSESPTGRTLNKMMNGRKTGNLGGNDSNRMHLKSVRSRGRSR
jgi:hypothetical protein